MTGERVERLPSLNAERTLFNEDRLQVLSMRWIMFQLGKENWRTAAFHGRSLAIPNIRINMLLHGIVNSRGPREDKQQGVIA